jgi:hypothetical protein
MDGESHVVVFLSLWFISVVPRIDRAFVSLAPERGAGAAGEGKPGLIRELLVVEFGNPPVAELDAGGCSVLWDHLSDVSALTRVLDGLAQLGQSALERGLLSEFVADQILNVRQIQPIQGRLACLQQFRGGSFHFASGAVLTEGAIGGVMMFWRVHVCGGSNLWNSAG